METENLTRSKWTIVGYAKVLIDSCRPHITSSPSPTSVINTAHVDKHSQEEPPPVPDSPGKVEPEDEVPPNDADQIIVDNFPRAQLAQSAADLPPINARSRSKKRPGFDSTPLFIGFTRNWCMLQQCVVAYLNAGWPADQIYVIDNSGTMFSNVHRRLSLQNPFFLNHTRLEMLGVNIVATPTLLTFSQLQNFYLWTALSRKMPFYFWAHMDTIALSFEGEFKDASGNVTREEFRSLYDRAIDMVEDLQNHKTPEGADEPWGTIFFHYDWLALVNTKGYDVVGGWDTHIPSYIGDWDFYFRLTESGYWTSEERIADIYDAEMLDDIEVLYRKKGGPPPSSRRHHEQKLEREEIEAAKAKNQKTEAKKPDVPKEKVRKDESKTIDKRSSGVDHWEDDEVESEAYKTLRDFMQELQRTRDSNWDIRQSWHLQQQGGKGEPYHRHPLGFQKGLQAMIQTGYKVYRAKWAKPEHIEAETGLKWSINRNLEDEWALYQDEIP